MKKLLMTCLLVVVLSCKNNSEEKTTAISQQEFTPEMKESISRGAQLYNNFCASCHLSSGEGIQGVFPPLQNSDWLVEKRKESIHAVKFGLRGPIEVNGVEYDNLMPQLGLSDREVADVMNYINNAWGNNVREPVTEEEVAAIKK
ncbi:c-type cytochrome [Salinimicrobium sediminilitoris]|uniref:c-type cytochrome n=1 Tax=Salinimicrobium sediminilitoris TaxID=2876715 RepID=UPI001E3DF57E|nr:cytochrome c [Salinimicrobium sediminilitoris]MCC8361391.1 cytochrome c [Salinimicrobium sediminilitoris]